MLAVPLPFAKQRRLFYLFTCRGFFYPLQCVFSLSLSFPHGIHLVVPTHPYFFWIACHPSRTFPPKGSKQEPHNRFFPLPTAKPCPLTHDPPLPILTGYRLVVPGSHACFTFFVCCSYICCDLEIGLYVLPCTFGFLWRGLFSDLPLFMPCFFWGLGLVGSWAFLPPTYSMFTLRTC